MFIVLLIFCADNLLFLDFGCKVTHYQPCCFSHALVILHTIFMVEPYSADILAYHTISKLSHHKAYTTQHPICYAIPKNYCHKDTIRTSAQQAVPFVHHIHINKNQPDPTHKEKYKLILKNNCSTEKEQRLSSI